jgi:predicted DsbA family dithiol-disulfide isomerase
MPEIERAEDGGVEVEWLPFELRPAPDPLPDPRGRYIRDHWRNHVYRLALDYGTEIHVPVHQPRSTLALSLALPAEDKGCGRQYREAGHRAFFIEGRDLSDENVLRGLAEEAGLEPDDALAAAWDPENLRRLRTIRSEAADAGVQGVPALVADGELVLFGAPSPRLVRYAVDTAAGDAAKLVRLLRAGA